MPSVDELFEFELAYLEFQILEKTDFLEKTAYTKSFKNQLSKHFLMYSDYAEILAENRSSLTKEYFKSGQFSTGYATHGLFPYRGKFHPQMIKGLLNILGVKAGETVLDPMAGSGTTNIEASLLGINSYAVDVSPFCQLMIETKYNSLLIDNNLLESLQLDNKELFAFFSKNNILKRLEKVESKEKEKIYKLALLAYLDALGYSKRVKTSNHEQLFEKVLKRYIETVKNLQKNEYFDKSKLGKTEILKNSEALNIELPDNSVDCVITSPPYSFAIDYAENDKDQLEYLGYDTVALKEKMIGLKGKRINDKLENYFIDTDKYCQEIGRVLKKEKYFAIVIGSNTNQTGGIRLEQNVIYSAEKNKMKLVKSIIKPIKGMRNTMKEEYILFFEKQ
ncbi:MAG: hypothetical protein R2771_07175 [Saprospiraceae bacterium]